MNAQNPAPLRAVVSARVSVDDVGKGLKSKEEQASAVSASIEGQVTAGLALIAREGYTLVCDPLIDDGISGFKGADRAGFDKLMRLVIAGQVDVIVTRAIDRIGRNDADNSAIRIATAEYGVRFQNSFSGAVTDPRDAGGKLNLQVMQGIAEYQSALKSETLRNVYGAMRDRGELRSSHKAFGWQWEKGNPKRSMLAEPKEHKLIQEAYQRVLAEESLYGIAADWDARGIPTVGKSTRWSIQALRSMLLRPSNALLIRDGNGWDYIEGKRGTWDRLIDDETYMQTRSVLLSPSRRTAPGRKTVHLLSGIVRCGLCGAPLRSSSVADKKGGRMPIYRCVSKMTMPKDKGVKHVSARIASLDTAARQAIIAAFVFGPANLFPDETPSRSADIHRELDALLTRRQNVLSLVADGLADKEEARGQLAALKSREAALRAELETAQASEADSMHSLSDLRVGLWNPNKLADLDAAAEYADAVGERFDALPVEKRRALIRHLLYIEIRPLAPGVYHSRRWLIVHRRATSLNDAVAAQALSSLNA